MIGVIGYGVVGKAAVNTLKTKFEMVIYDKYLDLDEFENLRKCEFVFIMVPTPFDCKLNKVDLSAIKESLERLEKIGFEKKVIVKSTLPPGTCDSFSKLYNLEIIFNPEFLRESITPNEDFQNQDTIVIGTNNKSSFDSVKKLYQKVAVPSAKYYHTTPIEAEMIKCSQNTMLASRVALGNMIDDACQGHNIDYDKIKEIAFDRFSILGPHMVQVPGPDGKRGFGGKCLPKDIRALSSIYKSELLDTIISYNDTLRDDLETVLKNYEQK